MKWKLGEEEEEEEDDDEEGCCSEISSDSGFNLPVFNRFAILGDYG